MDMFGFSIGGGAEQNTEIHKGTKAVEDGLFDRSKTTEFQGFLTKQSMWMKVSHTKWLCVPHNRCVFCPGMEAEVFHAEGASLFFRQGCRW